MPRRPPQGAVRQAARARGRPGRGPRMANLQLKIALGSYGHTAALKDGTVRADGIDFEFVEVRPLVAAFRRMVRSLEFDVCEMAFSTYLVAREFDKPFTALPVFPFRGFPHGALSANRAAGVQAPR